MANPNRLRSLSRRDLLKLGGLFAGGVVLNACSNPNAAPAAPGLSPNPTATEAQQFLATLTPEARATLTQALMGTPVPPTDAPPATPQAGDQATATRVATATPAPQTLEELMASEPSARLAPELRDKVEGSYSAEMGVDRKAIQLKPEKKKGKKGTLGVVVDAATQTPLYCAAKTKDGYVWREVQLPDIASADGRDVGVSVDGSEPYRTAEYKQAVQESSTIIMPDGSFSMDTWAKWGTGMAETFTAWAAEMGARMRMISAFHIDQLKYWPKITNTAEADAFMQDRLNSMIDSKFIRKGGKTEVVICHEDTVGDWGDGQEHWVGEGADKGLQANPLWDVYKKEWPVKATQKAVEVAMRKGFVIGEDLVFAFSDGDLLHNSLKAQMYDRMMKRVIAGAQATADAVAKELNIPSPKIRVTLVDQTHMHADKQNSRGWPGFYTGDINAATIKANADLLGKYGDLEASEVDVSGTQDMNVKTDAVVNYSNAAFDAGVTSVDMYQALRFDPKKPENVTIFKQDGKGGYAKTKMAWRLAQSWYQRIPAAA